MKSRVIIRCLLLCFATLCAGVGTARAASRTWDGSANALWSNGANWVGGIAPQPGDSLVFPVSAIRYVTTNDFAAGYALAGIRFDGSNYVLRGNRILLQDDLRALANSGPITVDIAITIDSPNALTQFEARSNSVPTFNGTIQIVDAGFILQFLGNEIHVAGAITGPGDIEIAYCDLYLDGSAANTYTGDTHLNGGNLFLNKTTANSAIPPNTVADRDGGITHIIWLRDEQVADSAVIMSSYLDLNGNTETLQDFYTGNLLTNGTLTVTRDLQGEASWLTGNGNGRIILPAGSHRMVFTNALSAMTIRYELTGPGNLVKVGNGLAFLEASNSFTGSIIVSNGVLEVRDPHALGGTAAGVTVRPGATLMLASLSTINNESVTLEGQGHFNPELAEFYPLGYGALHGRSTTNAWNGPVIIAGASASIAANTFLYIGGAIQGADGLEKFGAGIVSFGGGANNTYSGQTLVREGVLQLEKINAVAIPGNVRIGSSDGPGVEILRLARANQIADTAAVIVTTLGRWELNGYNETVKTLASNFASDGGEIALGTATLTVDYDGNGSYEFGGTITGAGGFTKRGIGYFQLNNDNTYTGSTLVQNGTLVIVGEQPNSPVTVLTGARLSGYGTIGHLQANGGSTIWPGLVPWVPSMTASNITLNTGSTLRLTIFNSQSNTMLNARGSVTLNQPTLELEFNHVPTAGEAFILIRNDGADAPIGTFAGYPAGQFIGPGGLLMEMDYSNDVILRVISPGQTNFPPGIGISVTGGNGNGAIDPNECNQLQIAIFNNATNPLPPFQAMLLCDQPGVAITQPASGYPLIPPQESAWNLTPFQISTPGTWICGSNIQCRLLILTTNGSGFEIPVSLPTGSPGTAMRFDAAPNEPIMDGLVAESAIEVDEFPGYLARIEVSAFLEHTMSSDLTVTLVAPNGVEILLAAALGNGPNYGTNCADPARVVFADDATNSIASGNSPFVGVWRPVGYLSVLRGMSRADVPGRWTLRVRDNVHFNTGVLRCWSLFLHPAECTDGGGACDRCPGPIVGSITLQDPVSNGHIDLSGKASNCFSNAPCDSIIEGSYHYRVHTFTNLGAQPSCVSVRFVAQCTNDNNQVLLAAAYLGSFNPASVCANLLGTMDWYYFNDVLRQFSFQVPGNSRFQIAVTAANSPSECSGYTLEVDSPDLCPVALNVTALSTNRMRLDWPTSAAGYTLESATALPTNSWNNNLPQPIVTAGRFVVTNEVATPNGFYRLHKP